jgi:hypothetical protein
MTNVTVTAIKTDWARAEYSLVIDGVEFDFDRSASQTLTDTTSAHGHIIFDSRNQNLCFWRQDTHVWVDFGSAWIIENYADPAIEIQRRVALVDAAFEAVRKSYEKSWTVTI